MSELAKTAKPCARRLMNIFYLIDTSYSMEGSKIEAINNVMPSVIEIINDVDSKNADNAKLAVSCLEFSTGCKWTYNTPQDPSDYIWQNLAVSGCTDLGAASIELCNKLSRSQYLKHDGQHFAPAIIIMSDGGPTDDWKAGLKKLKENKWFNAAIKVAIAIGNDADKDVLAEFIGNKELVITVHDVESLRNIIQVVSRGVSEIGSKSSVNTQSQTVEVENMVEIAVEETPGAETLSKPAIAIDDEEGWD